MLCVVFVSSTGRVSHAQQPSAHGVRGGRSQRTDARRRFIQGAHQCLSNSPTKFSICSTCTHSAPRIVLHLQQRSVCLRSQAIGGESPRAVVDNMGDIFMALNRHQFEAVSGWLKSAVERPGFPSQRVTQQSKEQFAKKILKYASVGSTPALS